MLNRYFARSADPWRPTSFWGRAVFLILLLIVAFCVLPVVWQLLTGR